MDNDSLQVIRVETGGEDQVFNEIFQIRREVFVDELDVGHEDDYDGFDHISHHYLALHDGQSVGTGRWRRVQTGGRYRIERIAIKKGFRRTGIGSKLINAMLVDIPRDKEIFIHVPVSVLDFFVQLGFAETGFVFEEAGISHKKMVFQSGG